VAIRGRDALFIDQRGTGRSHPLDCDLGGTASTSSAELPEMFPPAEVRACAERLSQDADLRLYTSVEHADDVEEVRRHLGYGPLNIQGQHGPYQVEGGWTCVNGIWADFLDRGTLEGELAGMLD
jgi:pimeloyl-ACP methyl ester carboxylesterase